MTKLKIRNTNQYFIPNNIYCVGKNYLEHIKEFGGDKKPEKPVIFLKPNSAITSDGKEIIIPEINNIPISSSLNYELELVAAISKSGYKITEEEAEEYIFGYAVGLDMTLRDIQSDAKTKGLPWTTAKGFYTSAPVSDIILKSEIKNPMNLNLQLEVNNTIKQFTNTGLMLHNIYKLISYISSIFYIRQGDIIFTGTPPGVGEVKSGDKLSATLENYLTLNVTIK